jgi:lipopolysaccharide/colanic/teichoic acid biosynthesis glycosyltransferase
MNKILIIGGSGFVGQQISTLLSLNGVDVISVGRATPGFDIFIESAGEIVHQVVKDEFNSVNGVVILSVVNNDKNDVMDKFISINSNFPVNVANLLTKYNKKMLFCFGSSHAAEQGRVDSYSISKRKMSSGLASVKGLDIRVIVAHPIYGEKFVKRMAWVDRLPSVLRSKVIAAVGSIKPLLHVNGIVTFIEQNLNSRTQSGTFVEIELADDQSANAIYRFVTRLIDVVLASAILVVFWWLYILVAVAIALDSPGGAIFRQVRVGRGGQHFVCYKFRTMVTGSPQVATHNASKDMTTRIGSWLRRLKLDELPQVFNILRNDMSWVGPRPCLPSQEYLIAERNALDVLTIKPGVTGLAQVQSIDMSDPVRLAKVDRQFLVRRSIPLYISILVKTFLGGGAGDPINTPAAG